MTLSVNETLRDRKDTHGNFKDNAQLSRVLKDCIYLYKKKTLTHTQLEALDCICAKIARICTGNPNHWDSWHDIAGYATLIEKEIIRSQND